MHERAHEFLIIPPYRNDLHRQHEIAMATKKQLRKVHRDYEHELTRYMEEAHDTWYARSSMI